MCGIDDVRRDKDGVLWCPKCGCEMPENWLDQLKASQPAKTVERVLKQIDDED